MFLVGPLAEIPMIFFIYKLRRDKNDVEGLFDNSRFVNCFSHFK